MNNKDYLFFCTGECNDSLRDRYFYLVRDCSSEESARTKLQAHFNKLNEDGINEDKKIQPDKDFSDYLPELAEDYTVFVSGNNLKDGFVYQGHPNFSYSLFEV